MNNLIKFSFFFLLAAALFTACQDDDSFDEVVVEDQDYQIDTVDVNPLISELKSFGSDSLFLNCIYIPYPIDFLQVSGDIITVNSGAELDSAANTIADFVYPFDAVDENGAVIVIEDFNDLTAAVIACSITTAECADYDAHILLFYNALNIYSVNKYVYEINYPVTLVVQGNQVVLNSDDDYIPAIGGSPNQPLETELVYPITVSQFGQDIVLESDADVCTFYETLLEDCSNKPPHIQFFFNEGGGVPSSCAYFINYPVDIISNSGATLTIQSRDDYLNELNSSPNAYDNIELIYPVSMTRFNDGQQFFFDTDTDICQYLDNNCQ